MLYRIVDLVGGIDAVHSPTRSDDLSFFFLPYSSSSSSVVNV
jgi:hypothetical protein